MTLREYRENTSLKDQEILARKLQIWLGYYSQEVYEKVMRQMEEIINNEATLNLLDELYNRTLKEREEEVSTIRFSLGYEDQYSYHLHNHCLTHSNSYRDVLYDMYIRD